MIVTMKSTKKDPETKNPKYESCYNPPFLNLCYAIPKVEISRSEMCIFDFLITRERHLPSVMSQDQPGQPQHRARVPKAPPPNQNRENEPITVYARRFGAKSPGRVRSWLTPLNPLFPINWENGRSDELHQVLGDYQKEKLYNFTTRELKDLDALCDRPVKEPTLKGCIIPLLRRERWEDKPSTAWRRTESVPIVSCIGSARICNH